MTVIAQDDHLTAGAWAACDFSRSFLKRLEIFLFFLSTDWDGKIIADLVASKEAVYFFFPEMKHLRGLIMVVNI